MRTATLVGLFVVITVAYGLSPVVQNTDSYAYPATAWAMVHDRSLALEAFHGDPAIDGHHGPQATPSGAHVNRYPWLPAVLFVPAIIVLDLSSAVGLGPGSYSLLTSGTRFNALLQLAVAAPVTALAVVLVAMIAFDRLTGDVGRRRRLALLVAGIFALGTSAWSTVSRSLWQHGPGLVAAAAAVLLAQRLARAPTAGRRVAALLGVAVAVSYMTRPTHALTVVAFSTWVIWKQRQVLLPYLGGAALVGLPWLVVNGRTWGSVLPPYYSGGRLGLDSGYLEGLGGTLVSPSRGLLVFCPIVILAGARLFRTTIRGPEGLGALDAVLGATVAAGLVTTAALSAEAWWGGHSYGPRLSSDLLVYFAALAVPTIDWLAEKRRAATSAGRRVPAVVALAIVAAVWSVALNAEGALFRSTTCWNNRPDDIDQNPGRLWSWRSAQFLAAPDALRRSGSLADAALGDDCT